MLQQCKTLLTVYIGPSRAVATSGHWQEVAMMTLPCYMRRRHSMLATDMHSNACLVQTQRKF